MARKVKRLAGRPGTRTELRFVDRSARLRKKMNARMGKMKKRRMVVGGTADQPLQLFLVMKLWKTVLGLRPEESWVVFRRYTDFARLNDKLKEMFPGFRLALPPKRWFKDNFDPIFLEDRQAGLQAFLQNLVAHKDVTNCIPVRDFLCLDEPPGPFDSLVESRAFCEGLEETNYQLQRDLLDRQREIDTLRVSRDLSTNRLAVLEGQLRELGVEPRLQIQSDRRGSSSEGEYSTVEADQSPMMTESSPRCTGAPAEMAESPEEQTVAEVEHHPGLDDSSSFEQAEEALALNE
uniref:sorting nexin-16-like isoform X2 n=1 Tax=Myxine glutinosa TaxID=7769 RepID=UPI00358E4045